MRSGSPLQARSSITVLSLPLTLRSSLHSLALMTPRGTFTTRLSAPGVSLLGATYNPLRTISVLALRAKATGPPRLLVEDRWCPDRNRLRTVPAAGDRLVQKVERPRFSHSEGTTMKRKGMTKQRPSGLIRYPGGKAKLLKHINSRLERMVSDLGSDAEYREPFFGAGAVGLSLLAGNQRIRRAWLNDADPAMSALWDVVIHNPTNLHVTVEVTPEAMRLFPTSDYYQEDLELLRTLTGPEDLQRIPAGESGHRQTRCPPDVILGLGHTCWGTDEVSALSLQRRYALLEDLYMQRNPHGRQSSQRHLHLPGLRGVVWTRGCILLL